MSTDRLEPVAILWDIENCGVPQGVSAEDVSVHIRMALKFQLAVRGPVIVFAAYGDFSHLSVRTRQGCQKTGVDLIDIPHGTKDAADKAILVDMFLFALDNPPPGTLVLITGDVDFAPALHKLGQRGYSVVLAIPSGRNVSPALLNACHHLWSWPDIARGKCAHPMHNVLPQIFHQDNHNKGTFPSIIKNPKKTATTCAGTLGNKPSEAVGTVVGNVGGKSSTFPKFAIKDNELSTTFTPNAEKFCIDQVKGNDHSKNCCSDGVGDNPNFGKLEMGPPNGSQIACEAPKKIPVDMFEEHVEIPFYAVKESSEIPISMGMDRNCVGATEIPTVTSHGMAGFAKEAEISALRGTDGNGRGAFDMNRSVFPPACSSACPVASNRMIDYENASHVTSQGTDGRITSSKFKPWGGEYVCNQFAIPNPGGVAGAFEVRKEGFEHSWKGPAHYMEAEYEHHFEGMHQTAGVGPSCKIGHTLIQYALPPDREWNNPCALPCNVRHTNVQGPVTRSQSIQQGFKLFKTASKQAARAKGKGQDPSLQLKVKKTKMKKTKKMSNVEAAPAATPKLTKKQRKAARLAAIQMQGTEPNSLEYYSCEVATDKGAAPAATPKLTKKQRKAARLAAIQTQGTELNKSLE